MLMRFKGQGKLWKKLVMSSEKTALTENLQRGRIMSMAEAKTHTVLHVLKGAVQKVLGARPTEVATQLPCIWTAGVFVEQNHGRLTLQFDRKPTEDEMKEIENLTNGKINENVPVEIVEMGRAQAEERFGKIIYDLFSLPPHIQQLRICNISDWNMNCCNKEHCKTTGEIGSIKIDKVRFRDNKQLLEIPFDVI